LARLARLSRTACQGCLERKIRDHPFANDFFATFDASFFCTISAPIFAPSRKTHIDYQPRTKKNCTASLCPTIITFIFSVLWGKNKQSLKCRPSDNW